MTKENPLKKFVREYLEKVKRQLIEFSQFVDNVFAEYFQSLYLRRSQNILPQAYDNNVSSPINIGVDKRLSQFSTDSSLTCNLATMCSSGYDSILY